MGIWPVLLRLSPKSVLMKNRCITFFRVLWLIGCAGKISAAGEAIVVGDTVELPPFVVTHIAPGPGWRCASIPGFEILSQCSDRETREVVAALWRGPQLILPIELRSSFSVPMTVVLFNQPHSNPQFPNGLGSEKAMGEINPHWTNVIKRSIDDRESFSLNLWGSGFDQTPAFRFDMRTQLNHRFPAAPDWLKAGLFGGFGVHREGVYWDESKGRRRVHVASWCSWEELTDAKALFGDAKNHSSKAGAPNKPSSLLSFIPELQNVLERSPPEFGRADFDRWAATSALFVRWGAFATEPVDREKFWRFVLRSCAEPVTESLFKECFGRSYSDVRNELSWYLAIAIRKEASVPIIVESCPKIVFRDATNADFARIFGEWQRIEAKALAVKFPDLAKEYRDNAVRTLERAFIYKNSRRDPRILASLGLLAVESDQFVRANDFLEEAIHDQVTGPSAYLELARLRWAKLMTDEKGTLTDEDRRGIIQLLLLAEKQQPSLLAVYSTLAQLTIAGRSNSPEQIAALQRGLNLFPKNDYLQTRLNQALLAAEVSAPSWKQCFRRWNGLSPTRYHSLHKFAR